MRKVFKNISDIPPSLESEKTVESMKEIINRGKYPGSDESNTFNKRYKEDDVKEALLEIYRKKCAYCEKDIGDSHYHIEHYRPKSIYYWLAYSWDNLLLCCDRCNTFKGNSFDIKNAERMIFSEKVLSKIHSLCAGYNDLEKPLMVQPELDDVEAQLDFNLNTGHMESKDQRCQYTIDTCHLDRKEANDNRKKIWDDFYKKVKSTLLEISLRKKNSPENKTRIGELRNILRFLVKSFKEEAENPDNPYLSFRRYIVRNHKLYKNS